MLKSELDFIWNISLICPWDCDFCCTDAVNVTRNNGNIIIRSRGLEEYDFCDEKNQDDYDWPQYLSEIGVSPNYLDKALQYRQERGLELTLKDKIKVLDNLETERAQIDFAGGDPLACAENLIVIIEAANKYGKENISVTSTGHSISRYPVEIICDNIGVFEFTYDEPRRSSPENRPQGYNASNLIAARKLGELGVYTKCQIPLHSGNLSDSKIDGIVSDLTLSGVDEILLMRTFPVGRGLKFLDGAGGFDKNTIMGQIGSFNKYSKKYGGPKIRLQCALRHLYESNGNNPCDLMSRSYGINYQGLLLLSAWATNSKGDPLADDFILGDLVYESFSYIENSNKFQRFKARLDENWGHCKIFSFISTNVNGEDAIFSKNDPLYISTPNT